MSQAGEIRFDLSGSSRLPISTVAAVIFAAFICAGCVTEIVRPAAQTALFTTRAGDQVALSWKSKLGEQYSIWYATSRESGSKWIVLPGCERLDGTGDVMQKTDQVPAGVQRYYRIVVAPASK